MLESRPQTEEEWQEWKDAMFEVLDGIQKMQMVSIGIVRDSMEKQVTVHHFIFRIMSMLKPELGLLDFNTDEVDALINDMEGLINETDEESEGSDE